MMKRWFLSLVNNINIKYYGSTFNNIFKEFEFKRYFWLWLFVFISIFILYIVMLKNNSIFSNFIIIMSMICSFCITLFVLDKFKYSDVYFISYIQKNIFKMIKIFMSILLIIFMCYLMENFNINILNCIGEDELNEEIVKVVTETNENDPKKSYTGFVVRNDYLDDFKEGVKEGIKEGFLEAADGLKSVAKNIGLAGAAGVIGATAMKVAPTAMPLPVKVATGVGTTLVTALGLDLVLNSDNKYDKNAQKMEEMKKNVKDDDDNTTSSDDDVPSPSSDGTGIFSILDDFEIVEISVQDILFDLLKLKIVILVLLMIKLYIMIVWVIRKGLINFFNKLVENKLSSNNWINKTLKILDNKSDVYFVWLILILYIIVILFLTYDIYLSWKIIYNFDGLVDVYNLLKNSDTNKSLMYLLVLNKFKFLNLNLKLNKFYSSKILEFNEVVDYVDLKPEEKIYKFDSYKNYLDNINKSNIINKEFMEKYYPDYVNNNIFILILEEIYPYLRTNVELIIKIFSFINEFNDYKFKILVYSEFLNEKLLLSLIRDMKKSRVNLIELLKRFGLDEDFLNKLIEKIDDDEKKIIMLQNGASDFTNKLGNDNEYIQVLNYIKIIIKKDVNYDERLENLLIDEKDYNEKLHDLNVLGKNAFMEMLNDQEKVVFEAEKK